MSRLYNIKKGINIKLGGESEKSKFELDNQPNIISINPSDFPLVIPKLMINEGNEVKVGTPIFYDKKREKILVVSPVSGKVKEIIRGEKRKILSINIENDFNNTQLELLYNNDTKQDMLTSGLWTYLIQRPLAKIADYDTEIRDIFISEFDSSPLGIDYEMLLRGKEKFLQIAIDKLKALTSGKIYIGIDDDAKNTSIFQQIKGIEINYFTGKHPAGNVGTQIHKVKPINKGEVVITINPLDLARIGEFFSTGKLNFTKTVSIAGNRVNKPQYVDIISCGNIEEIIKQKLTDENSRIISGNILTGTKVQKDGYLDYYSNQICIIAEGNQYKPTLTEGWLSLGINKLSNSNTYLSKLLNKKLFNNYDTNTYGEKRAFVVTGQYEEVFPWDILPVQLLKSIIANDIDNMEKLGIYEVAPEDFAQCEFVCTSKIDSQSIVRQGLNLIAEECF